MKLARRRLALALVCIVVVFGGIVFRLVQLQVVSADRFEDLALSQRLDSIPIAAQRGSLFDRNGIDLALSAQRDTIWANPQYVSDPAAYAAELAPIVGEDEDVLLGRLSDKTKQFVYVARSVDDDVAATVRELALGGIDFLPTSTRFYPAGDLAAPVLGSVGLEGTGLGGLEYSYEDQLAGVPGVLVLERDRDGRAIPRTVQRSDPAERGTDLVLTLDESLQYQVEQSLADQVTAVRASSGVAILVDTTTGDVLAMANVVADEAGVGRPVDALGRNRALADVYEPGSTNKIVTFAAALDAGVVGRWTEFDVPDWITVDDRTFKDSEFHPIERWSTEDCLVYSSNVCAIRIGQALGSTELSDAFERFGFGAPALPGFPGEAAGLLADPSDWYNVGLASASMGYGLAVTPMQMLGAFVALANDGVLSPPRLVAATIDGDGVRDELAPRAGERAVSSETAATMRLMMEQVVSRGTGTCAAVPGYTVGGKTGTARKIVDGQYSNQDFFASFAGIAPVQDPRLAAIVVIDDPDSDHRYGGRAAAPVFAEIMQFALRHERIPPPVATTQWEDARASAEAELLDCSVPHGEALDDLMAQRAAVTTSASSTDASVAGTTEDTAAPDDVSSGSSADDPDPETTDSVSSDPSDGSPPDG